MAAPTLKDVAAACGYSSATVAFILRGHPKRFPEETRAAVHAAAKRLGYRANAWARAVRNGRIGVLALVQIVDDLHGDLAWSTFEGIASAVESAGEHLIVTRVPKTAFDDPEHLPRILQQFVVDGLLLSYHTNVPKLLATAIRRRKVPAVWINHNLPDNCVYLDDRGAAIDATNRLIALGHRRIAYVNIWQASGEAAAIQHYSMIDRLAGYRAALRQLGLPEIVLAGGFAQDDVDVRCERLLRGAERVTGVVLYHASMAPTFLAAAARLGLTVPRDLSLVTFSDRQDVFGATRIDGVHGDYSGMGAGAVAMLHEVIAHPGAVRPAVARAGGWYHGNTLAAAPL
jgi:LacI family transcriptional regulator